MNFVSDWSPTLYDDVESIVDDFYDQLCSIVNKTLEHVWVVWNPSSNQRFFDGPVVLCFDNQHLEIAGRDHRLAISWNTINMSRHLEPLFIWDQSDMSEPVETIELYWRDYPDMFDEGMIGSTLRKVCVVSDRPYSLYIDFSLDNGLVFAVFNYRDSTGVSKITWKDDPLQKKYRCFEHST